MSDQRKNIGNLGENIAGRFLLEKGYKILARNYRKPWGEIDIIAEQRGVVVFCEVKTNSKKFGLEFSPELRVNREKVWQITKTAKLFLQERFPGKEMEWRIDVLSVIFDLVNKKAKIKHFLHAVGDSG